MALCCRKVDSDGDADGEVHAKSGLVPSSGRKCRDVLCCLLFLVYWLGMVVVAIVGMQTGEPLSLVYGRDYNGSVCGVGEMANRTLTAYPRLNDDMVAAMAKQVPLTKMPLFGVCVHECPTAGDKVCTYDNAKCWMTGQTTTPILFRCMPLDSTNETIVAEQCLDPADADPACTLELFVQGLCKKMCKTKRVQKTVWEVEATTENPVMDQLQGSVQTLGRFVGDTSAAATLILVVGGGGALVLGVVWLVVLQFFAGCVVWLTCWIVVILLVVMSLFCSVRGGIIDPTEALDFLDTTISSSSSSALGADDLAIAGDEATRLQFQVAAYVMWGLTALIVLLIIAMRKRIRIAIAIIREASRAIRSLPLLLLWPVIPTAFFIALVIYGVAIAAYIASSADLADVADATAAMAVSAAQNLTAASGSIDINGTIPELPSDTLQKILLAYHLFGFLWTNQLIQAISLTTIAGAVAQYYWTAPDGTGQRKLEAGFPILRALKYAVRYSLGSLCFGSFIIALVQFARIILEYLDHQSKQLQESNRIVKVAFLAVRCCLWCFEKCLKFLSKNAYILIAMRGMSFCSASVAAFKLLYVNIVRVAVVNSISFFMLFLVKTTITVAAGGAVFVALSSASASSKLEVLGGTQPVTSPLAPVLIACVLAWLVASAFTNVYGGAIDTILLCFCEDAGLNGEAASEYMSDELRRIMGGGTRNVIQVSAKGDSKAAGAAQGPQPGAGSNKVHVEADI